MDRTSWIGMVICLSLLFAWGAWSSKENQRYVEARKVREAQEKLLEENKAASPAPAATTAEGAPSSAAEGTAAEPAVQAETIVLANEYLRLNLTNQGGGIKTAEMLKHAKTLSEDSDPLAINENSAHPVGALSGGVGKFDTLLWSVVEKSDTAVTFERKTPEGLRFRKTFTLPPTAEDPYAVQLSLAVINEGQAPYQIQNHYLYVGSASPLHLQEWSMQIGMYWMDRGKSFEYKNVDHYGGRKILGIFGKNEIPGDEFHMEALNWAGVNDQFFTTTIKPEKPYAAKLWGSRIPVVVEDNPKASRDRRMFAAEAGVGLPELLLNVGNTEILNYEIYLGPKEYSRLKAIGDQRERVMNYDEIPIFGWLFGWAIKPLASWLIGGLVFLKGYVGSYGLAIVLITIIIRLLIWPVYAKSARSMKRMAKLAPMMKELREKYADDPQKMNSETMRLYQTYGINPLGGCLPMFIQLPVFLAFYRMLWSAVELRHESWLWVDDLAMPDTLMMIPFLNVPLNILPILMGLTSFIQIAITPKTGDKTQQMVFMLMPFIFLFICYNFAAALSLYWTTSNVFSILQTWITNKMPEPELKKRAVSNKKSFFERLQAQAEANQRAKAAGGTVEATSSSVGRDRTRLPGEKGDRHTKSKKKRK